MLRLSMLRTVLTFGIANLLEIRHWYHWHCWVSLNGLLAWVHNVVVRLHCRYSSQRFSLRFCFLLRPNQTRRAPSRWDIVNSVSSCLCLCILLHVVVAVPQILWQGWVTRPEVCLRSLECFRFLRINEDRVWIRLLCELNKVIRCGEPWSLRLWKISSTPPACHIPTIHFWFRSLLLFFIINLLLYFLELICLRLGRLGLLRSGLWGMTPMLWGGIPSDYRMRLLR